MRNPLKPRMLVCSAVVLAVVGQGCKSNNFDRRPRASSGVAAPTTSSAVSDVPASVLEHGKAVYDTGAKQAGAAYEDVNQLATKAAGDLKAEAARTQAELNQTAQAAKKAVGARAKQATDDLFQAIEPKESDGTKAADDPVVLPDPSTGQP